MQAAKKRKCAADLLEQAGRIAHKQQGLPYDRPKKQPSGPLVPVYIGLDSQSGEYREQLLWRINEKEITTAAAAARLCSELCLPAAQFEKFIEQQIDVGIKHYKAWKPLGGERLVKLRVAVKRGEQLFRDVVLWDLSNPHNTPALYASVTCSDLRLDQYWYEVILMKVQQMVEDLKYELQHWPEEVPLEQAPDEALDLAQRRALVPDDERGLPRVEAYDPLLDWGLEQDRRRAEKLKLPGRQYPETKQPQILPPEVPVKEKWPTPSELLVQQAARKRKQQQQQQQQESKPAASTAATQPSSAADQQLAAAPDEPGQVPSAAPAAAGVNASAAQQAQGASAAQQAQGASAAVASSAPALQQSTAAAALQQSTDAGAAAKVAKQELAPAAGANVEVPLLGPAGIGKIKPEQQQDSGLQQPQQQLQQEQQPALQLQQEQQAAEPNEKEQKREPAAGHKDLFTIVQLHTQGVDDEHQDDEGEDEYEDEEEDLDAEEQEQQEEDGEGQGDDESEDEEEDDGVDDMPSF